MFDLIGQILAFVFIGLPALLGYFVLYAYVMATKAAGSTWQDYLKGLPAYLKGLLS